jgi:hypothetical protein
MKNRWLLFAFVAATLLMVAVFAVCQIDASHGERSLAVATPFVTALNPLGGYLFNRGPASWYSLLVALGLVVVVIGVLSRDRARRNFFCAALAALVTQLFLINQSWQRSLIEVAGVPNAAKIPAWLLVSVGCAGYIVSALFVARAVRSKSNLLPQNSSESSSENLSGIDFLLLMGIFALGLFFRTYALNQITHGFDGELACYMAGATSLKGMLLANEGIHGPWAPLGVLYYLPMYVTTKFLGTTLLAVRLSSALVGLLTIFPLFVLVWMIAGKRAGLFAAFLFALDCLHIGWSYNVAYPTAMYFPAQARKNPTIGLGADGCLVYGALVAPVSVRANSRGDSTASTCRVCSKQSREAADLARAGSCGCFRSSALDCRAAV